MDIVGEAMKIEKKGQMLYRAFAQNSSDKGAVFIFTRLADQEKDHYDAFKKMKDASQVTLRKNAVFKEVLGIFSGWQDARTRLNVKMTQVELYRKALEVEEASIRLYEEGAEKADNDRIKAVFLQILAEEKEHRRVMENIIEFVTKPESWFEDAEFGHKGEEYYL